MKEMILNENYTEILKLNEMLTEAEIPHSIDRLFDGYQIVYFYKGEPIADAIEHFASYGSAENLLEIMGCMTSEEEEHDDVLGYLTADEVFKRFATDFINRKLETRKRGD